MKKLRSYLAAASVRLGLPMDIAAGLPHLEVNGFRECSVDRHTGILEYNRERIVIGLNIGSLTVVGSGLEIRQMHRERLTIIGQIEGHQALPENIKTTKYEHVIPLLAAVEESEEIDGLLLLLNTVGGDIEAGLAIAELIAGMKKPTVSLVLGGGHSIGIPLAVSARRSFIVPTATMTVHPVRHSGLVLGVPQTMRYFEQMQQRITGFVAAHSGMPEKRYTQLMLHTGELVMDMGTVLDGRRAVKEKLIDELGGLSDALAWLYKEIEQG